MNENLKSLLAAAVAVFVSGGCCTSRHVEQWEYKVVAGGNANVAKGMNSAEKQEGFLNAQGKEGWIFVQEEGGIVLF
jgi:hypothetical protein